MQLSAIVTRDELAVAIGEIAPVDVELARRPRRVLAIGKASLVELVPGVGLRVRAEARLTWNVAGVSVPVTVRSCQVLVVPTVEIRDGAHVLAFEPRIEALEIGSVPGFVADGITGALEGAIESRKDRLAWPFERQLALHKMFPERVSPPSRFDLVATDGAVAISDTAMTLALTFGAHIHRANLGLVPDSRRSA